jgi:hypothetical protein
MGNFDVAGTIVRLSFLLPLTSDDHDAVGTAAQAALAV